MGKKINGASTPARAANQAVSVREEASGRTPVDEASLLRVKHLQLLAVWAGPVGALLGRRLASSAEAAMVPLGTATFLCQRCETVLKPGFICSVRIRNKRNKAKRRKKSNCCQNSISYACHFCGDHNLILGSGKGAVKSLLPSREHATMDLSHIILRGNDSNTRIRGVKLLLENSQAASLQVGSPSRLRQSTSERGEHGERLKCNIPADCKMEEHGALSTVKPGHLIASASEEDITQVTENTNDEQMHQTETISREKVNIYEANCTSQTEHPQKKKLPEATDTEDSAELLKAGSKASKTRENPGSISGNTLSSSSKSAPIGFGAKSKCAASDSTQVSGSLRKRARKGWTTLKQIAEKDELKRKEKMGNFVIPFFMQ